TSFSRADSSSEAIGTSEAESLPSEAELASSEAELASSEAELASGEAELASSDSTRNRPRRFAGVSERSEACPYHNDLADFEWWSERLIRRDQGMTRLAVDFDRGPAVPNSCGAGVVGPTDPKEEDEKNRHRKGLDTPSDRGRQPARAELSEPPPRQSPAFRFPIGEERGGQQPFGDADRERTRGRGDTGFIAADDREVNVKSHGGFNPRWGENLPLRTGPSRWR
ncbi:MAG: hypothetical protein RI963_3492, partial [Planctomycetota bacterium]